MHGNPLLLLSIFLTLKGICFKTLFNRLTNKNYLAIENAKPKNSLTRYVKPRLGLITKMKKTTAKMKQFKQ